MFTKLTRLRQNRLHSSNDSTMNSFWQEDLLKIFITKFLIEFHLPRGEKMSIPGLFFSLIFGLFKHENNVFSTNKCEKYAALRFELTTSWT